MDAKEAILAISIEGALTCENAFKLAKQLNMSPADIGAICNDSGIKIVQCQLGCFP